MSNRLARFEIDHLIESELSKITDLDRYDALTALLVEPKPLRLGWNYGRERERLDCWEVGRGRGGDVILVYCQSGFGPAFPWGFVFPEDDSLGTDGQWHAGLEDAAINCGLLTRPPGYESPGPRC